MTIQPTDEDLMLAYQWGDENAFAELYQRHSGLVLGYLVSKIGDSTQAHDVFQGTFMKLHRSRSLYEPHLPFKPWLFTLCRNELLDFFKKEKRITQQQETYKEEIILQETDGKSYEDQITTHDLELTAFSQLSPEQQKVLSLRYKDEQSFDEIAILLSKKPSNIRKILSRSIQTLRDSYEKK